MMNTHALGILEFPRMLAFVAGLPLTPVERQCLDLLRPLPETARRLVLAAAEVEMEAGRPW
jgi:hypothetical protein